MAMSMAAFSPFLAGETASPAKRSSSSLRLLTPAAFQPSPANLRASRTVVTYAIASNPSPEFKTKRTRGIAKERPVSPEMKDFLGGKSEIRRAQAIKEIWAYIKEKSLQDPTDKKFIVCDEKLKTILAGRDRVGFLEISGLITPHFLKSES